jgi:threonine dehydrogenase-like Zn-dependent dehydrogenase
MKAVANFPEPGEIRVVDAPEPKIQNENDVLVKTLAIGLCGTDREIADQDYGGHVKGSDYLIIGHECLGEVVEAGSAVTKFKQGDLVVPRVRRPCPVPSCRPCRMGRPDFCLTGEFTERGILGAHGFMCERFVDHQEYFHLVPANARKFGVLTEPLTIAMKSFIQMQDLQARLPYIDEDQLRAGDFCCITALVLGGGPVGLLGALALIDAGAKVYVYSRTEEPNASSELIESCGGEYISSNVVSQEELLEITGPVDLIYEATGASTFAMEMAAVLGRNGLYVLTGVPGRKGPVPARLDLLMRDMVLKNQLMIGTVNAGPPAFDAAIAKLENINRHWPGTLEKMITQSIEPDAVAEALSGPKSGSNIKQVVCFDEI